MEWTEERLATLTKLRAAGHYFSAIAKILGTTRNAVIGKAHRLGLYRPKRYGAPKTYKPRKPRISKLSGYPVIDVKQITKTKQQKAPPTPAPVEEAVELDGVSELPPEVVTESAVTLLEAQSRHCRWPIGDPGSPSFLFCGRPIHQGSFCLGHAQIAYAGKERRHAA